MSPSAAHLDEADLLRRIGEGGRAREEAFGDVFEALRGPVHALCLGLVGDPTEAEDVVQEVFLAVHRGLAGFAGRSRISTWVYRIAFRIAVRARARQARRPAALTAEPEAPESGGAAERMEGEEGRERIARALGALPAGQRAVLTLFAIEGLAHAEIADILGIPEGTVWSRLHTARRNLAARLG